MTTTEDVPVRQAAGGGADRPGVELAAHLNNVARLLQGEASLPSLLHRVVAGAGRAVSGAEYAGIGEVVAGQLQVEAASDPLVNTAVELESQIGEGPCLCSMRQQLTVGSQDLARDQRWPSFAQDAVVNGIRSVWAVPLLVAPGDNQRVLALYASAPQAFSAEDETASALLATHADIAMAGCRVSTQLRAALTNRDVIGQAKGILMERFKVDEVTAFQLLTRASQNSNQKLRVIADTLAKTGRFTTRR